MKWEIESFKGLGPVLLGMTRQEVGLVLDRLGPVKAFNKEHDGSEREHRDLSLPVINYLNARVSGIDTSHYMQDVVFKGLDLYQEKPDKILKFLEQQNQGALIALGLVLFDRIGLSATGFYLEQERKFFVPNAGEQDDRGVGISAAGAFDAYRSMFKPISFVDL